MATINMNLTLPVVSSTLGPDWATELNTAITTIDAHDHTSGKGQKVPTAGLNINADLDFNSNAAIGLKESTYDSLGADTTVNNTVYVKSGNLHYRDAGGNNVRITSGGAIDIGSVGGIGGDYSSTAATLFYTDASLTYFFQDSASAAAKIDIGELACTTASPTTGVRNADGSVSAPSYGFTSDTDTGIYRPGTNIIGFTVNGADVARMTTSGLEIYNGANASTIDSAATAARTFTLPDASGTAVLQGERSMVSVEKAAHPINGTAKIPLNAENFDTNGEFDNVTNFRFTATREGYYQVSANAEVVSIPGNSVAYILIYKNGAAHNWLRQSIANVTGGARTEYGVLSGLVYLNGSTDYIELFGITSSNLVFNAEMTIAEVDGP